MTDSSSTVLEPDAYSYPRYLTAKETVDDRSLSERVWRDFLSELEALVGSPARIVEVGAGTGATARRMAEALPESATDAVDYTLVDVEADNLASARDQLLRWGEETGYDVWGTEDRVVLTGGETDFSFTLVEADLFDFAATYDDAPADAVVGQAVFDLLDVPAALQELAPLLQTGGLWYLPIHFDGVTAFEPTVDPELDAQIERLFHESMVDEEGGRKGATAGRRLLVHLRRAGMQLLGAGASDWVVLATGEEYPGDEAYFLHHILHFVESELRGHPDVDEAAFEEWLHRRRQQIAEGTLIYIAHQLDVLARKPE